MCATHGKTRLPLSGRGQGHVTFLNFAPNYIFGIGEARHFKFHVLIDTDEYSCMHDYPPKGCVQSHVHNLFKFREISDNISLTVRDRGIVAMERS